MIIKKLFGRKNMAYWKPININFDTDGDDDNFFYGGDENFVSTKIFPGYCLSFIVFYWLWNTSIESNE